MKLDDFVSKNCKAFVVIEQPEIFWQSVQDLLESDSSIRRAFEIVQDQTHALVSDDDFRQLEDNWEELKDSCAGLNEVSIVLHQATGADQIFMLDSFHHEFDAFPKFTIVLKGDAENLERVESILRKGQSTTLKLVAPSLTETAEATGTQEEDSNSASTGDADDARSAGESAGFAENLNWFLKHLTVKRAPGVVAISNDEESMSALLKRIDDGADKASRSLARHRSYQQIQKLFERTSEVPTVRGFFEAESFPTFATERLSSALGFIPKTLRAGGFTMKIGPDAKIVDTGKARFRPTIEWDFAVTFTKPVGEFGKIAQSFVPVTELPALTLPIGELTAIGFDAGLRQAAYEETIRAHDTPAEEDQLDVDADLQDESDLQQQDAGENGGAESDDYNPFGDYEIYGPVAESNEFDVSAISDFSDTRFKIWITDDTNRTSRWLSIYPVKDYSMMEAFLMAQIKDENRYASADEKLVETTNDFGRLFVKANVSDAESVDEMGDAATEFFLDDHWMISTDSATMKGVLKDLCQQPPESSKFKCILDACKKRNDDQSPVKVSYLSHEHRDSYQETEQLIELQMRYAGRNEELKEIIAAGPDEFGLYGDIETKEDALSAVKQLFSDGFNNLFGTSIELLYVQDNSIRILGQYYWKTEK